MKRKEGRGKREEGRGKREEGRGKREEGTVTSLSPTKSSNLTTKRGIWKRASEKQKNSQQCRREKKPLDFEDEPNGCRTSKEGSEFWEKKKDKRKIEKSDLPNFNFFSDKKIPNICLKNKSRNKYIYKERKREV